MALVIPFRAVRPKKKYAGEVASFPYDVLDREEGRAIVRDNPLKLPARGKIRDRCPGRYPG